MTVVHVRVTCAEDYVARRAPVRQAHIERLLRLRAAAPSWPAAPTRAAGPRSSSTACPTRDAPGDRRGGSLPPRRRVDGYAPRNFETFVDPWEPEPPVVLDGSRPALVVEGPTADRDMAQLALVELRGAGRVVFGGFLPGRQHGGGRADDRRRRGRRLARRDRMLEGRRPHHPRVALCHLTP